MVMFSLGLENMVGTDLQHLAYCIEEPTVRVDFFLILSLENKSELHWNEVIWIVALRKNKLRCRVDGKLGGILGNRGEFSRGSDCMEKPTSNM